MLYVICADGQYLTKDKTGRLTSEIEHAKLFFARKTAENYVYKFFNPFRKTRMDFYNGWITVPYDTLEIVGLELSPVTRMPIDETMVDTNGEPTICQMAEALASGF